jgi:predicted DNA-binding protein YlxM (UPF0122 family)
METRKQLIQGYIKEGKSYSEIGKIFNITKQRVYQIWKPQKLYFLISKYRARLKEKNKKLKQLK